MAHYFIGKQQGLSLWYVESEIEAWWSLIEDTYWQ